MNYYGDDYEYANGRLTNTIVNMVTGEPAYIRMITGINSIIYSYLSRLDENEVGKLKDIDLQPVKLGWVNTPRGIAYTTRIPARRWKQGLDQTNLFVSYRDENVKIAFPDKNLRSTILNSFPKYSEVKKLLTPTTKVAFSRNWAVSNYNLMYNGRVVGALDTTGASLHKREAYLKEFFQEVTGDDCAYI